MYCIDYHIHSKYSSDSDSSILDIAEGGIRAGLKEIAITDHSEFNYPLHEHDNKRASHMKRRYDEIKDIAWEYQGRIVVLCGTELGEPWYGVSSAENYVRKNRFDFVLASLHGLNKGRDYWWYKPQHVSIYEALDEYFECFIKRFALFTAYDCISHFTYPLRKLYDYYGVIPDLSRYYDGFISIFKGLVQSGKGLELNTSGLNHAVQTPYPNYDILKLYRSCGGEIITTGSDAHTPDRVGMHIADQYQILKTLGFKYISTFRDRTLMMKKID
jgi:histidinol-phosphatase (PHP family)